LPRLRSPQSHDWVRLLAGGPLRCLKGMSPARTTMGLSAFAGRPCCGEQKGCPVCVFVCVCCPPEPPPATHLGFSGFARGDMVCPPRAGHPSLWVGVLPDVGTRPLVGYGTRTGRLAGCVGRVVNLVLGRGIAPRRVAPPEVAPVTRLGSASGWETAPQSEREEPGADHDGFACFRR
jgi:hypothetical protein